MDKNKVIEAAAKLIAKGQLDKAAKEFQRALDVDPDDVRILQKLAELYQKMGKKDLAADCFEKVAKTYAAQGFYLKAVALYKQVLKVVERIEVNVRLAELYQQLGLIGDATKEWQNVAAHYEKIGDLKASLDTLKKLVDLDPDNVAARIRLGEQYARQENLIEAVSELRRAAAYLQRNSRQDDYLRVAERISHLDPGDATLARELAESYMSRGDAKRALAKLQICFKANPRDLQTLQMLARAFQDLGQVTKTVSVLKELARVHLDAQRPEEARRTWQQAQEFSPDDPDIAANLEQLEADLQGGGGALPARTGSSPGVGRQSTPGRMPSMHGGVGMRSTPGARPGSSAVSQNVPRSATGPIAGPQTRPIARPQQGALTTPLNGTRPQPPPPPPMSSPGVVPAVPQQGQAGSMSTIAPMTQLAAMSNVPKLLKETEVYVKYGLHEKALDHLGRVFAIEPDNTEALEKAKTLAIAMKRPADAAESLAKLVRLYSARSDPRADTAKAELRALDPSNVALGLPAKLGAAFSDDDRAALAVTSPVRAHLLAPEPPAHVDPQGYEEEEVPFTDGASPVDRSAGDADNAGYAQQEAADISGEYAIPADRETEEPSDFPMGALVDNDDEGTMTGAVEDLGGEPGEGPQAGHHDEALNTVDESLDEGAVIAPSIAFFEPLEAEQPEGEDHFASDLAEADFYIDAGLPEDARAILEGILLAAPDHPGALSRLDSLAAQGGQEAAPLDEAALESGLADAVSEADTMAAELAAELASEVAEFTDVDAGPLDPNQTGRIDAPNPQAEAVHREDAQTHYDLGIAYKEMGLLDEAVAEFQLALEFGGGVRKVDCITILGVCAIEMGNPEEAVEVLTRGMHEPGLPADAMRALGYELGQAYEALGENQKALGQYKLVERSERGFRDAAARIQRLGGTITQPIQTARPKTGPVPKTGPIAPQQTQPPRPAPVVTPAPPAATPEKTAQESADELQQRRNRKIGFI